MSTDPRVDAYINSAAPFARPILEHLRAAVHEVCPDIVETMKWRMPSFEYKGPLAGMAAHSQHCSFGFWKGELITDPRTGRPLERTDAMGHFGRITGVEDLPPEEVLKNMIAQAVELNEAGVKARPVARVRRQRAPLEAPDDFREALQDNPAAKSGFERMPPSYQREYIEWIIEAKRPETRAKRISTALEWLAEGKSRNWKYERKS